MKSGVINICWTLIHSSAKYSLGICCVPGIMLDTFASTALSDTLNSPSRYHFLFCPGDKIETPKSKILCLHHLANKNLDSNPAPFPSLYTGQCPLVSRENQVKREQV